MLEQAKAVIHENSKATLGDCVGNPPSQVSMKTDSGSDAFQAIIACDSLPLHEKQEHRIAQEAFNLVVAAGATTAVILTTATYHLLIDQDNYLVRLKEELEAVMKDPYTRVSVQTLEQLPWLVSLYLPQERNCLTPQISQR